MEPNTILLSVIGHKLQPRTVAAILEATAVTKNTVTKATTAVMSATNTARRRVIPMDILQPANENTIPPITISILAAVLMAISNVLEMISRNAIIPVGLISSVVLALLVVLLPLIQSFAIGHKTLLMEAAITAMKNIMSITMKMTITATITIMR